MRHARLLRLLASVLPPLLLTACASLPGTTPAPPPRQSLTLLALVNHARGSSRTCGSVRYGATGPLRLDAGLTRAAQLHSMDMAAHGTMSHTGSDGSTLADRVERQGYAWRRLGENVAAGFTSARSVVEAWLTSPGHCANTMDPAFEDLGTGVQGSYWTLDFGTPR